MVRDHLDGLSLQKIADTYEISKTKAYRICHEELEKLPNNNEFTFTHCNRFSQIFLCDGKYIHVKGYRYKIPLLWGVDYFRHDIPIALLSTSENYHSWAKFFAFFRIINSYPQLIVCDDNINIKVAARKCFPQVKIQTCVNHYKEHIRRELNVKADTTYTVFSKKIDSIVSQKLSEEVFNAWMGILFRDYHTDPVCLSVLTTISRYKNELTSYRGIHQAPLTTNLMECLNSHLQARLASIECFDSFSHAKLWLNGYILKRRFTKLVDCSSKFRYLNGKRPIDQTKKLESVLPTLF